MIADGAAMGAGGTGQAVPGLLERIRASPLFANIRGQLDTLVDPRAFIGRAPEQVLKFLEDDVKPALKPYANWLDGIAELSI